MKKFTAWLLTIVLLTGLFPTGIYAKERSVEIKGNIDMTLNFSKPFTAEELVNEKLEIKLVKNDIESEVISLDQNSKETEFSLDGVKYNAILTPCNLEGVDFSMAPGNSIYFYKIKFIDLPSGSGNKYVLKLTRNNFGEFKTTTPIIMTDNSKYVEIEIDDCMLSQCDANSDGKIDEEDITIIRNNLGKSDFENKSDVDKDGKVDISDIGYVYRNRPIGSANPTLVGNYTFIDTNFIGSDLIEATVEGMGDISPILTSNNQTIVELKSKNNMPISQEEPLTLNIDFSKKGSVEMSQIKMNSPMGANAPTSGVAIITNENGVDEEFKFESNIPQGVNALLKSGEQQVITINLGRKIAVKKIVFNITATQNPGATLAEVSTVEFLKDIIPEKPINSVGIIKGFTAEPSNESVTLSWNSVPNMTGYVVKYGEESGKYTETVKTDKNSVTIKGLENLTTYYFVVRAVNGSWEGSFSQELSAVPKPESKPNAPLGIVIQAGDKKIKVSWAKSKNTVNYTLYYKSKSETNYKSINNITETTYTITELTNNVEYLIYLTSNNSAGTSPNSVEQSATPKEDFIGAPKSLPTLNMIENSHITSIKLRDANNVNKTFYPNGYNPQNVIDRDYTTHYTESVWSRSPNHIVTFDKAYEMDYVAYVTRLDSDGVYKKGLKRYNITVWGPDDDLSGPGEILNIDEETNSKGPNKYISVKKEDEGLAILTFPKRLVKQIELGIDREAYQPASASEIYFYEYYPLAEEISALFENKSFTKISSTATLEKINALREIVSSSTGYFINKEILTEELNMAEALLSQDTKKLGRVVTLRTDMPSSNMGDLGFSYSLNNFQPLGISAMSGKEIAIYVDCNDNDSPQLVVTQYNPNWNNWQKTVPLTAGRNVITVPKIGTDNGQRGGSIYVTYSGSNNNIEIQVKGGTQIPILDVTDYDLNDVSSVNISLINEKISQYVAAVAAHTAKTGETNINNSTEIATRDLLLSIPAQAATNKDVNQIYDSLMAWQKEINLIYSIHGLSKSSSEIQNSWPTARLNMRYTRLFDGAFMYASSGHIGMGYSTANSMLGSSFGWGISHEIGHVIDQSGLVYAETTNNIYSLFSQVNNGSDFTGVSRLESSNKYKSIYDRVSVSAPGISNDCFTALGMYWQLHLAYDDAGETSTQFYPNLYKKVRDTNYRNTLPSGINIDDLLMISACDTIQKDLTEFFERWGISPSDSAKSYISGKHYTKEDRAIYYLNDEARRYRLAQGAGLSDISGISATLKVNTETGSDNFTNNNTIEISITNTNSDDCMLGYEIIRNGENIAFTTEKTYTDNIGATNNISLIYQVIGYDKLGNKTNTTSATEIKINHDVVLDSSNWKTSTTTSGALSIVMDKVNPISGIKVNGISSGSYTVRVSADNINWFDAKVGDFSNNESTGDNYVGYFNKPKTNNDKRIWTFDSKYVEIEANKTLTIDNVDLLAYPGDNITMDVNAIGKLKEDFTYENGNEKETIPSGTMVVTGSYRGDPIYNIVALKGLYSKSGQLNDTIDDSQEERFVAGYSLMFAEIPEDGEVSEISDGFWIFVPSVQNDNENENDNTEEGHKASILPNSIRAELYRSVNPNPTDTTNSIKASDTVWVSSPNEDSMPLISFTSEKAVNILKKEEVINKTTKEETNVILSEDDIVHIKDTITNDVIENDNTIKKDEEESDLPSEVNSDEN